MAETPLAFDFSKTRTVCDAFDDAWAFLQGIATSRNHPSHSGREQCCERIIKMADQGLMDVTELRDDALAFVEHNPPSRQFRDIRSNRAKIKPGFLE